MTLRVAVSTFEARPTGGASLIMPPTNNVYVYSWPANPAAPPPPLISGANGTFTPPNLYSLPAAANTANLVVGNYYSLTMGPMSQRNKPTQARCNGIAPPSYVLIV
jgi:hypothetical protein